MSQKIAIYDGEGASLNEGFRSLEAEMLNETSFFKSGWEKRCTHFVMPGGRDRPYHAILAGSGNQMIRSFVEEGGIYVGICAGAYYGCGQIEFDLGTPLEVNELRELSFFPGKAVGPAYGKGLFRYESEAGVRAAKLNCSENFIYAYYNGGCFFEGDFKSCRILARYADLPGSPPAVIECPIGKGKAILSGVHLEISSTMLKTDDPHHIPLFAPLRSTDQKRLRFWEGLFKPSSPALCRQLNGSEGGRLSAQNQGHCS